MFKILRAVSRPQFIQVCNYQSNRKRTFLSQAYYCKEIWNDRLNSPILQKVNLDILYHELDQRFHKTRRISAVDVDVFANAVRDDLFIDELMDLVHKLRLTPDTGNALDSTTHAIIRALIEYNRVEELLLALDDRLNYGLFLDDYTGNMLLDTFWKSKNFVAGCVVASQFMLQEDFTHPLTINFSILHCYSYLKSPGEWPQAPKPEEPEEEVKVRVKYLRNPYNDEHFDLKEPKRIVGKTLAMACKDLKSSLHQSLKIIGLVLFGKEELIKRELDILHKNNTSLVKEVVDLLPDDISFKQDLLQLKLVSEEVESVLQKNVQENAAITSEKDIATQCDLFRKWENQRLQALEEQKKRLLTAERLAEIERIKKSLQEREQKLWFFENEEKLELTVEDKLAALPLEKVEKEKAEEEYIPPEVTKNKQ